MREPGGALPDAVANGRRRLVCVKILLTLFLAAAFLAANVFPWLPWPHLYWTIGYEEEYNHFEHGWPLTYMSTELYRREVLDFGARQPIPWPFSSPPVRWNRPTALAVNAVVAICLIASTVLLCDSSNRCGPFHFTFTRMSMLTMMLVLCAATALLIPGIRGLYIDEPIEVLLCATEVFPLFVVPKYVVVLCCVAPVIWVMKVGFCS